MIGVVYSAVISSCALAIFAVGYILYYNGFSFNSVLIKRFVRFSWPLWLAGFSGLYVGSSSQVYIKFFSDLTNVGIFELSSKFAAMLGILIWAPFSQWWQTERFKIYQSDDKGVTIFPVVFNAMAIILTFAGLGITLFGETVIRLMADAAFYSAAVAIPFLVVAKIFGELTNFFRFSFLVTENTLFMAYIGYASAVSLTVFLVVLVPIYGFIGAAIAIMINNILVFVVFSRYSKKYFDNHIVFDLFVKLMSVLVVIIFINYLLGKAEFSILWDLQIKIWLTLIYIIAIGVFVWQDKNMKALFIELFNYIRKRFGGGKSDRNSSYDER